MTHYSCSCGWPILPGVDDVLWHLAHQMAEGHELLEAAPGAEGLYVSAADPEPLAVAESEDICLPDSPEASSATEVAET